MIKKCTFQSILFVVEKLYINFSDQDLCQLEAEFISLRSIILDDTSEKALKGAAICHGDEEHAVACMYHLSLQKIPGTSLSKFHHLFNFVQVFCCASFTTMQKKSQFFMCQEKFDPIACLFRIR